MAVLAEQAGKLLDFNQKLDIQLLDNVVTSMYTAEGEQVLYCISITHVWCCSPHILTKHFCTQVLLTGMAKTLTLYHQPNIFIHAMLIATIDFKFYHMIPLSLTLGWQGECKAKLRGLIFSHIFQLIWMKVHIVWSIWSWASRYYFYVSFNEKREINAVFFIKEPLVLAWTRL